MHVHIRIIILTLFVIPHTSS